MSQSRFLSALAYADLFLLEQKEADVQHSTQLTSSAHALLRRGPLFLEPQS